MTAEQLAQQARTAAAPYANALARGVLSQIAFGHVALWLDQQDEETSPSAILKTAQEALALLRARP